MLRFSTATANQGLADFVVGDPQQSPDVTFSQCHQHYHYHQYAEYRLVDAAGTIAGPDTDPHYWNMLRQQPVRPLLARLKNAWRELTR